LRGAQGVKVWDPLVYTEEEPKTVAQEDHFNCLQTVPTLHNHVLGGVVYRVQHDNFIHFTHIEFRAVRREKLTPWGAGRQMHHQTSIRERKEKGESRKRGRCKGK
jgi:hypothetical protein